MHQSNAETVIDGSVDVIVVHYNRADLTTQCVEALARDEGPLRTVTIVDSGSESPIGASQVEAWNNLLVRPHLTRNEIGLFIESLADNVGFAEGNNRGLASRIGEGAEYYLVLVRKVYATRPILPYTRHRSADGRPVLLACACSRRTRRPDSSRCARRASCRRSSSNPRRAPSRRPWSWTAAIWCDATIMVFRLAFVG